MLEHEQKVTGLINKLYEVALKQKDYAAQVMLQWFINEQVEEEKNASTVIDQLRMAGDDASALLMLDQMLGSRTDRPGRQRRELSMWKWIHGGLAVLVVVLAGTCYYGYKQLTDGGDSITITIDATPERVFASIAIPIRCRPGSRRPR